MVENGGLIGERIDRILDLRALGAASLGLAVVPVP
jgi:hypothetical protein